MTESILIAVASGTAALSGIAAYGTFVPSSQLWGRVILRGPAGGEPSVALTFDDGPTPGPTERVLDILGTAGIKATFFVIGANCRRAPALLQRIYAEGHLVGNHTFDHSHYGSWGMQRYWDRQLRQTDEAIASIIGVRPAMFRPPMGIKQFHTMRAARKGGQQVVGWTRKARDGVATTSAAILDRLAEPTLAGDILLLHDGIEPNSPGRDPQPTIDALPILISRLKDRGLRMQRLDELLQVPGYQAPVPLR
ncbi:polysaccharide deacetylase family protein [Humisphaera borealis]|uniref:Polysaccharide deacetylase family protein n=1 Tax=Humisphaera borealis TaxID=2807512 RepID=A0A7M2X153_9BACT|nr:polysaccharide deacetylase family protein [Humisphaera borealis]QOV91468.1 polysaccharide deacetylase family protein [Humisphaera borealis]